MEKFSKAVKQAAFRANALDIPEDIRKDWMTTQVLLELAVNGAKRSL
jgi:hypothetical protein